MKTSILIISAISLIAVSLAVTGCERKQDDVAMFRGDLARTGVYHTRAPQELTSLIWKFKTDGKIHSSPVISRGIVYFGSEDGNLYAVK